MLQRHLGTADRSALQPRLFYQSGGIVAGVALEHAARARKIERLRAEAVSHMLLHLLFYAVTLARLAAKHRAEDYPAALHKNTAAVCKAELIRRFGNDSSALCVEICTADEILGYLSSECTAVHIDTAAERSGYSVQIFKPRYPRALSAGSHAAKHSSRIRRDGTTLAVGRGVVHSGGEDHRTAISLIVKEHIARVARDKHRHSGILCGIKCNTQLLRIRRVQCAFRRSSDVKGGALGEHTVKPRAYLTARLFLIFRKPL